MLALFLFAAGALIGCGSGNGKGDGGAGGGDGGLRKIGGVVTGMLGGGLVLDNAGGDDDVTVTKNGRFTFATALAQGASYAVSVATQPSTPPQTCVVKNAAGQVGAADVTDVIVSCAPQQARYLLVADTDDRSVSSFALDDVSGQLALVDRVIAGLEPVGVAVAVTATGTYAYAVDTSGGGVYQWSVGVGGALTPRVPPALTAGDSPWSIAIDGAGRFVFVGSTASGGASDGVRTFAIGDDGRLAAAGSSPAGSAATALTLDPTGAFLYGVHGDGTIAAFSVGALGALTELAPATVPAGTHASGIAVDPTGRYLYAADGGEGSVSAFAIGPGGALMALPAASVRAGTHPGLIAFDPTGKTIFIGDLEDATISQFTIGDGGALSPATPAILPTDQIARSLVVDPAGKQAIVATGIAGSISQYHLDVGGKLSALPSGRVAAQLAPGGLALVSGNAPARPVARYAFVANGGDSVSQYTVGAAGALSPAGSATMPGAGPIGVAVHPSGRFAYVAGADGNSVSSFTVGATGALTALTPSAVPAGTSPSALAVHPSGRYLYVVSQTDRNLWQFAIDFGGKVIPLTPPSVRVAATAAPNAIAIEPSGRTAYVTLDDNSVGAFTIAPAGTLTAATTTATPTEMNPSGLTVSSAGFLYVANTSSNTVSQLRVASAGRLAPLTPATAAAGMLPVAFAVDPSGRFGYAVNLGSSDISAFTVGGDGALSPLAPARFGVGTAGDNRPSALAIDPAGAFLYVVDDRDPGGGVWQFRIDGGGGLQALTPPSVAAGSFARAIALVRAYQ